MQLSLHRKEEDVIDTENLQADVRKYFVDI